ncbi:MAG: DMT family transporter, partial [Anaerolineae bacterium]
KIPASLASMVLSSVPLFTLLLAAAARQEAFRVRGLIGALIALSGIAVLVGGRVRGDIPLPSVLAILATAICFSLGAVLLKSAPQGSPLSMSAISMLVGAPVLLALAAFSGETAGGLQALLPADPTLWWAQVYLVIPGTLGVYALMFHLLRLWPASTVSYQSVLIPPVTTLLSIWLLEEPVTSSLFSGGALVLLGVYVGALARGRPRP